LVLYMLSWSHRLKDSIAPFGRSLSWQSSVFNDTIQYLVKRYCDMLYWDHRRLTIETIRQYATAIEEHCGYSDIWGFIDSTIRRICRPSTINQKYWYTSYKKFHRFKFQAISTLDGLITSLAGPTTAADGD
jgi:hypothetical protein